MPADHEIQVHERLTALEAECKRLNSALSKCKATFVALAFASILTAGVLGAQKPDNEVIETEKIVLKDDMGNSVVLTPSEIGFSSKDTPGLTLNRRSVVIYDEDFTSRVQIEVSDGGSPNLRMTGKNRSSSATLEIDDRNEPSIYFSQGTVPQSPIGMGYSGSGPWLQLRNDLPDNRSGVSLMTSPEGANLNFYDNKGPSFAVFMKADGIPTFVYRGDDGIFREVEFK